jgi:hypothetical protein
MGKLSFIKNKNAEEAINDTIELERDRGDDYAVEKKSTSFYVASAIVSVLGAILIWLFAVSTGATEKLFTLQPELRDMETFVSAAEQSGFTVVVEKDTTVSFAIVGRQKAINNIASYDILVYTELEQFISEVNKLPNDREQTITAKIIIDAPVYFNIEDVSKEEITIRLVPINKVTE